MTKKLFSIEVHFLFVLGNERTRVTFKSVLYYNPFDYTAVAVSGKVERS